MRPGQPGSGGSKLGGFTARFHSPQTCPSPDLKLNTPRGVPTSNKERLWAAPQASKQVFADEGRTSWHQACLRPEHYSSSAKMQGAGGQALASLPQHAVAWAPSQRQPSASPPHSLRRPHCEGTRGLWPAAPSLDRMPPGQPRDPCEPKARRGSSSRLPAGRAGARGVTPFFSLLLL